LQSVPFDGPQQITAALGGHVDAAVSSPGQLLPHVRAGKAVIVGVFQEGRSPLVPDAPTFKELGLPVTLGIYQSIVAPKDTPAAVVRTLDEAFRKALAEPLFVSLAEKTQSTIDYKGAEAFTAEIRQGFEANAKLVEALGLKKK
jgi:tripartite-type tricarboxylate transporter receptor subunit TctC